MYTYIHTYSYDVYIYIYIYLVLWYMDMSVFRYVLCMTYVYEV